MKRYKILLLITFILLPHSSVFSQNLEKLVLEPGFKISIFAENLSSPRQMAEGQNGTIFIGERSGQIVALTDSDKNGEADSKKVIAKNLEYSTGISIFDGDLYFSEISKIWKKLANILPIFGQKIEIHPDGSHENGAKECIV